LRRAGILTFVAVLALGFVAVVAAAALDSRPLAFTLGVTTDGPAIVLDSGQEACQLPVEVVEGFQRVRLKTGTFLREGPPFTVTVRELAARRPIAGARVEAGYPDGATHVVTLSRGVVTPQRVAVCVRNDGVRRMAVFGSSALASRTSGARLGKQPLDSDMALEFLRASDASVLTVLPDIVERASLFRGAWATPAAYWLLLILIIGAPASLIAVALRAALGPGQPTSGPEES
jgi:hypothetical protein